MASSASPYDPDPHRPSAWPLSKPAAAAAAAATSTVMYVWNSPGRRLCASRILCFLRRHCLEGAAHMIERDTAVFFDVSHLQYLARSARWDELTAYVDGFMPFYPKPRSRQASSLFRCLHVYRVLGKIAAGGKHAEYISTTYPLLNASASSANPEIAALNAFFHQVLQHPPRDFFDWMQIWAVAAERLKDLALKCPELKEKLHLPHHAPKCWQISLSGVRPVLRPYTKKVNHQKARDIAYLFEEKRREITGSLSGIKRARSQDDCCTGSSDYDTTENSKRTRRSGDVDVKLENDFNARITSVEELHELRSVSTVDDLLNVVLPMIL